MSNLEKLKLVMGQIQAFIDEGIVTEGNCGNIYEEIDSAIEILKFCNAEYETENF